MILRKISKKGEDTSPLPVIIGIVILVIVAAFLIFWFVTGKNPFSELIKNIIPTGSNVAAVVSGCKTACSSTDAYSYCAPNRILRFEDKTIYKGSCLTLLGLDKAKEAGLEPCSELSSSCNSGSYEAKKCTQTDASGKVIQVWQKGKCDKGQELDASFVIKDESDKSPDYSIWKNQEICCKVKSVAGP